MEVRACVLSPCYQGRCHPQLRGQGCSRRVEVASPSAALAIPSFEVPAKESGPFRAVRMDEGQDPDAPKETVEPIGDASVSHVEGPVIIVEPLQSAPLVRAPKILRSHLLSSRRRGSRPSQWSRPPRVFFFFFGTE